MAPTFLADFLFNMGIEWEASVGMPTSRRRSKQPVETSAIAAEEARQLLQFAHCEALQNPGTTCDPQPTKYHLDLAGIWNATRPSSSTNEEELLLLRVLQRGDWTVALVLSAQTQPVGEICWQLDCSDLASTSFGLPGVGALLANTVRRGS